MLLYRIFALLSAVVALCTSVAQAKSSIFDSSRGNKLQSEQNYPDDLIQRTVARVLGDELPQMRDDLIQRKNNGEGAVERHLNAWTTKDNWKWDSKEQERRKVEDYLNEFGGRA